MIALDPLWFGAIATKATIVLAVAALIAVAMRRQSAASRHAVWLLGLLAAVALPLLSAALPAWQAINLEPVPPVMDPAPAEERSHNQPALASTGGALPGSSAETLTPATVLPESKTADSPPGARSEPVSNTTKKTTVDSIEAGGLSLGLWMLIAWLAGLTVLAFRLFTSQLAVRWLVDQSSLSDLKINTACADAARTIGLSRAPEVRLTDRPLTAMTVGIVRPRILLPADATDWDPSRLRAILLHELAHVKRRDCLWQLLAHTSRAVYWFHPLAWLSLRKMEDAAESACDDTVVNSGLHADDYAEHLLGVATGYEPFAPAQAAVASIARPPLEHRLRALLDDRRKHQPAVRRLLLAALPMAMMTTIPLAMITAQTTAAQPDDAPPAVPESENTEAAPSTSEAKQENSGEKATVKSKSSDKGKSSSKSKSKKQHPNGAHPADPTSSGMERWSRLAAPLARKDFHPGARHLRFHIWLEVEELDENGEATRRRVIHSSQPQTPVMINASYHKWTDIQFGTYGNAWRYGDPVGKAKHQSAQGYVLHQHSGREEDIEAGTFVIRGDSASISFSPSHDGFVWAAIGYSGVETTTDEDGNAQQLGYKLKRGHRADQIRIGQPVAFRLFDDEEANYRKWLHVIADYSTGADDVAASKGENGFGREDLNARTKITAVNDVVPYGEPAKISVEVEISEDAAYYLNADPYSYSLYLDGDSYYRKVKTSYKPLEIDADNPGKVELVIDDSWSTKGGDALKLRKGLHRVVVKPGLWPMGKENKGKAPPSAYSNAIEFRVGDAAN